MPDAVKAGGRTWSRKQRRMASPPLAERHADFEQVVARRRELVVMPAPVGRALLDLAEVSAAKVQVADDQRCPALGEDRPPGR
jgi:hypothetical protein